MCYKQHVVAAALYSHFMSTVFPNLETSQLQTIVRDLDLIATLKQQLSVLITKCAHCDICNTDMCVGCLYYPILHENRSTHTEKSRQQEQIVSLLFDIRHTLCISTHMVHTSDKRFLCIAAHKVHTMLLTQCKYKLHVLCILSQKNVHISTYGT